MPVMPVLVAVVGGAVGLFLDRGLSIWLPCTPYPEPWLTGWGWLVGIVVGLVVGSGIGAASGRGQLAAPPRGAVGKAMAGALLFTLVSTVMIGGIGYASGRRSTVDREVGLLRELRRDLDKKLIDADEAQVKMRALQQKIATTHEPRQAFSAARRASTIAAVVSALFGGAFAAMAVVYRRALATRDQAS
ncbi:MAG: hypothetical protein ACOVT5_16885 [Armatimonadaceae bacterium]